MAVEKEVQISDEISDDHLIYLSKHIVEWEKAAIILCQLTPPEIADIKEEYKYDMNLRRIITLRRWKTRFGCDATYKRLLERAEANGYEGLAQEIRSLLGLPLSRPPPSPAVQIPPPIHPPPSPQHGSSASHISLSGSLIANLTPDEKRALETRLIAETEEMRTEFTILLAKTVISLTRENVDTDQLMLIFRRHYRGLCKKLKPNNSIAFVFRKADKYWSFFEYEVLAIIINVHGSSEDKENMHRYIEQLKEYCRRRICEVPLSSFKRKSHKKEELYVKMEKSLDYPMKKLKKIEYRLSNILGHTLHMVNIKKGCLELTFICADDFEDIFPLNEKQVSELSKCAVIKLYSEQEVYYENENGGQAMPDSPDLAFPIFEYSYSLDVPLRIDEIRLHLSKIISAMTSVLSDTNVSVKRVANFIRGLPQAEVVGHYQSFVSSLNAIIDSSDMHLLMTELQKYINIFDYNLVDEIASKFTNEAIQREIKSFKSKVSDLRSSISVDSFGRYWEGEREVPANYDNLTVSFGLNPDECRLDNLEERRRGLCQQLEKKLNPGLIERATMFLGIETGTSCIFVTWLLPSETALDLRVTIRSNENFEFFETNEILSLSIGGCNLYTQSNIVNSQSGSTSNRGIILIRSNSNGSQSSGGSQNKSSQTHGSGRRASVNSSLNGQLSIPSQLSVSDLKLDFEEHSSHSSTNGQYPSICMNNKRWIIQVYHNETVVLLKLRYRIGYLNGKEIMWSNRHMTFNRGFYPRMSVNASGMVVVVYASQVGRCIYYRVGKLSYSQENTSSLPSQNVINSAYIHWLGDKVIVAEGRNPSVSLSDSGTVAIAYERGYVAFETFYRLGDITNSGDTDWRSDAHYLIESQSSKHVSIAINDRGQVAVGFASGHEVAIHYKGGAISEESADTIVLHDDIFTPTAGQNYEPFLSLNNHGQVIAVHHSLQGRLNLKTNYGLMCFDEATGLTRIEWANPVCVRDLSNNGLHISVAINDNLEVVTVHKSLTIHIHTSMRNYVGSLSYTP